MASTRKAEATHKALPVRWQIDIPRDHDLYLEKLMGKLGISQKKDFFNTAVTLLDWVAGEIEKGRVLASVDESSEKYREITMPAFKNIKRTNNVTLSRI